MDHRLRQLIERLKPYGLTKGEVLMIVNLGVGVGGPAPGEGEGEEEREGQGVEGEVNGMDVDSGPGVNGVLEGEAEAEPVERGEGEVPEEDYGPLALLDTVIEEREERLSDAEVAQVLAIIRESLTRSETTGQSGGNQLEFVHYNT